MTSSSTLSEPGPDPETAEQACAATGHAAHGAFCPRFHHAVELIGRRWTGVVLRAMLHGATRYTEIRVTVPDLSDRMLAERLKELEEEGIVSRTVVPSTPVRVEYHLTAKGRALDAAMASVAAWAEAWVPASPASDPSDAADGGRESPDRTPARRAGATRASEG